MRKLVRTIIVALFLSETLMLANGLLLVKLANKISPKMKKDPENTTSEVPRSISMKCTLPTINETRKPFEKQTYFFPPLLVVGKWQIHTWINEERVTNDAIYIYDWEKSTGPLLPVKYDHFTLTFDPAVIDKVDGRHVTAFSLPSELSSTLGIRWTERTSTKLTVRVLCRIELYPKFVSAINARKYQTSLLDLWNSIANLRPQSDWSRWEKESPPKGLPGLTVTIQPESMRKSSNCLIPHVGNPEYWEEVWYKPLDVLARSIKKGETRIPCYLDKENGIKGDCRHLYLELIIQLKTPKKPKEEPELKILMWPAKESAWPGS